MCILFALLFVGFFFAVRSGRFAPPWVQGYQHGPGFASRPGHGDGQRPRGPWGFVPPSAPRPEDEALKVLADRLASGDITPDEYLARVSVLRQQEGPRAE